MKIKNYKVSWRHHNHNNTRLKTFKLDKRTTTGPSFGQTECFLSELDNPENVITGEAICTPTDNYDKRLGRYLSFQRAVSQIPSMDERTELWNEMLATGVITRTKINK